MATAESTKFEIPEVETDSIEDKIARLENPHRDAEILRTLYWERGLSQSKVAERLGCSDVTVSNWLDNHDLGARDCGEMGGKHARENQRIERATFCHGKGGYERWTVRDPDGKKSVMVHQLLAIADGADPHDVFDSNNHVHHRTGCEWLNIHDGVEVVTTQEHSDTHRADEWEDVEGVPMMVTQRDD